MVIAVLAALLAFQSSGTDEPASSTLLREPKPKAALSYLFTANDYPPAAKGARAPGRVGVRLETSAIGRVTRCEVTGSSGHEALDLATCKILKSRSSFVPALNSTGQPVAADYSDYVAWPLAR